MAVPYRASWCYTLSRSSELTTITSDMSYSDRAFSKWPLPRAVRRCCRARRSQRCTRGAIYLQTTTDNSCPSEPVKDAPPGCLSHLRRLGRVIAEPDELLPEGLRVVRRHD